MIGRRRRSMYYKRLNSIFRENDLHDLFPEVSVDYFDEFIRKQVSKDLVLSPYKFALDKNISVNKSVKFFVFFTGDYGLLDCIYYFECSRPSCYNTRIYLEDYDLDEAVRCDECGKSYKPNTFSRYIKVLFKLKTEIKIPNPRLYDEKIDPNSTYEALKGLPPSLKIDSLSPSADPVEGENNEQGVSLEMVRSENKTEDGKPISERIQRFISKVEELEDAL